jgi:hypothetical protein
MAIRLAINGPSGEPSIERDGYGAIVLVQREMEFALLGVSGLKGR